VRLYIHNGLVSNRSLEKESEIKLDEIGFVLNRPAFADAQMPGVFAAGDIHPRCYHADFASAGEGATAASAIREYLEGHPAPRSKLAYLGSL